MTGKEFIAQIRETYVDARKLIHGNGGYNIWRGMSHSNSGNTEDLFAKFIAENIGDHSLTFLVDKPITTRFPDIKRAITFKPDLSIFKGDLLTHYFDLKMDLGWNRNIENYLLEKNKFLEELKMQKVRGQDVWYRNGKEVQGIQISNQLKYHIVIVSAENGSKSAFEKNVRMAEQLDHVEMYVLTSGEHLNTYNPELGDRFIMHEDAIARLIASSKQGIN